MNLGFQESKFSGCYELFPDIRKDARGTFVKTFHREVFEQCHLETNFAEEYYSVSHQSVLRGMHFQTPPYDHVKVVYCIYGEVMDVLVDLRVDGPTYGQYEIFQLSGEKGNMLYIPPGLAHGFYVTSDEAILMYKVTTVYKPENDKGLLWNSIGIPWPNKAPIISLRDSQFPSLEKITSPFIGGKYAKNLS